MSTFSPDQQNQRHLQALSAGLRDAGMAVLRQTADHRFDLAEGLPEIWPNREMLGLLEADVLPVALASQFAENFDLCRASAQSRQFDFELLDGSRRLQFQAHMHLDGDGILTTICDVTEQRSRETAVASLLREVSHRSKNLLAIVQSVAMQTAVHSGDIQEFLDKFRGRLHALSGTQDLVTDSNWRGTYLHALVAAQMVRIGQVPASRFRITGDNVLLGPNASLHLGLAIHELAANAVQHGAFAPGRAGTARVHARLADGSGQLPDLIVEWHEDGIDPHADLRPPRFGMLVLKRIVPLSVGGEAEYAIADGNCTYSLHVPADQYEA
jgi:two-component sensor histidine kinase